MFNLKEIKTILITGGAGFIGSNFLNKYVLNYPQIHFVNLDKLTYAGHLDNLKPVEKSENYTFVQGDICDLPFLEKLFEKYNFEAIIHFAAESHVDLSITNPGLFVEVNVLGTHNLLALSRKHNLKRFHHVSTDEVYGELGDAGYFTETTHLAPNSPYSASKAGSDLLVRSYVETFGFDATISRCSNNYGPNQDLSKLIPKFVTNLIKGDKVPLYKDGKNIRDWLFVEDHNDAIWEIFTKAKKGSVYNIGGNNEKSNMDITKTLLQKLNRDESYIEYVADRLGHDFRYAIDASKIKNDLGWSPKYNFETGITKTIEFYKSNIKHLN
jgi:dTDP-glucose 4,6-dehydratase